MIRLARRQVHASTARGTDIAAMFRESAQSCPKLVQLCKLQSHASAEAACLLAKDWTKQLPVEATGLAGNEGQLVGPQGVLVHLVGGHAAPSHLAQPHLQRPTLLQPRM